MNGNMESHWSRVGEFLLTTFLPPPSCDPVIHDTQARGNQWWNFTKLTDKYTKLGSRGLYILNEAEISWTYIIVVTLIIIINLSIQVICRCPLLPRLPCLSTDFDDILQLSCQMFRQTQPAASQTIITISDSNHTFWYFQHIVHSSSSINKKLTWRN